MGVEIRSWSPLGWGLTGRGHREFSGAENVHNLDLGDGYVVIYICKDLCILLYVDSLKDTHTEKHTADLLGLCKHPQNASVLAVTKQFPLDPNTHTPGTSSLDTVLLLLPRFMGTETRRWGGAHGP